MKKILLFGGLLLSTVLTYAQATISPAKPQSKSIIIVNATIHIGNGQVINNGYIGFDKGKITVIGEGGRVPITVKSDTIINAAGKQVYPGFICPVTTLGLVEVEEGAKGTVDDEETGDLNPNVRSIVAYNTDSKVIPTVRSNGILLAQPTPNGGTLSGQSSVVQLDAWNWEDAAYKTDIAVHLNWPVVRTGRRRAPVVADASAESADEARLKQLDDINNLFTTAKAYAEVKPDVINLRFEALKGLFNGSKKLFINVDGAKEIIEAVSFANKLGIKAVIVGGKESYLVTNLLKQNNVPVIIRETQTVPARDEDDVYLPYKLPKILQDAGVEYGLTGIGFWRQRNLPFEAGQAVGYGLSKEQALSMITINNAKILGIDKTTGTLETGKDANLFISTGDALDMITLNVEQAFIQGRNINLDNLHKQLYKKFSDKYGIKGD